MWEEESQLQIKRCIDEQVTWGGGGVVQMVGGKSGLIQEMNGEIGRAENIVGTLQYLNQLPSIVLSKSCITLSWVCAFQQATLLQIVTQGQTGWCVLHTNSVTSCYGAHLNVSFPVRKTARPFLCPLAQNSCVFDKVLSVHFVPNSWKTYKPFGSGYLDIDRQTDSRTDGRTKHTLSIFTVAPCCMLFRLFL